ncbi:hypothetical protein SAMN04515671_1729 [Nakamurella panacisegetis]|uniref:Uncharacterized protein n=2 Tax=Nakamurella panacisegetis TaxID=1090615 RepID=A0A1H0LN30_9ACTN|nr:hypothetical protein SAMN04515671_1729 [Nakamurella panacisegetis]
MTFVADSPVWKGRPAAATGRGHRGALVLSAVAAGLMAVASVTGLVSPATYHDPTAMVSMLRGFDLVTAVLVVPGLIGSLIGVRRGSLTAELVWVGLLAAAVYTYSIYVFGCTFNALFLVHVGVLSASTVALILALVRLDVARVRVRLRPAAPVRWTSVLLGLLALGLGAMWAVSSLRFALTGAAPVSSSLVETDAMVHLGYALDLSLLVPAYATGAVLLWRRAPWGHVIAAVVLVSGLVHQVGYLVAMPFQVAAGVPGAVRTDLAEPVIIALFLIAAWLLLASLRPVRGDAAAASTGPVRP